MDRALVRAAVWVVAAGIMIVGCSGKATQAPTPQPSFTPPPEDRGSAILVYNLNSKKAGFNAFSSIGIPIDIAIDPANTKQEAPLGGTNVADFVASLPGNDQGTPCTIEFTMLVDYEVRGTYHPGPACAFDITVLGTIRPDSIERTGSCSLAIHETYPAQAVFIPPPPGPHKVPGSLPLVPIRDDDGTKITIQLQNVVVPESSGCQF
jgi:hypothetical protein